jgi:hypothetical protein
MKIPLALLIAILSLVISSGSMIYSVKQTRSEVHLDPELERLALGFLQEEEKHRAYGKKVDAETHRTEQNLVIPADIDWNPPLNVDSAPHTSPHVKPPNFK